MMKDKIEKFLKWLPTITKEESDFIEEVIHWDSEEKVAFIMAKRMFEEEDEEA